MKTFIQNRKGQKVSVLVDKSEPQKGLAFVMHGLGGFKEQSHLETIAQAFLERGVTVVRFDTTNTFGESDGSYEDATITNYFEDLEDVIAWAQTQSFYQEPFVLSGHSLGGICTALYAEKYPEKVLALAPVSSVVSGPLKVEAWERYAPEEFAEWKKTGWRISYSESKPGVVKKLKWSFVEDGQKYDLLPDAHKLKMPVLLIVGEEDDSTPPDHVQFLYDAVAGAKEMHIIPRAPHTFRSPEHLAEIKQIFLKWIDSFDGKQSSR